MMNKTLSLFLSVLFISVTAFAQAPKGMGKSDPEAKKILDGVGRKFGHTLTELLAGITVVIEEDGAWVRLQQGRAFVRQAVTLGSVSAEQAVVESGVPEGAVVARRAGAVE